MNKSTNTFTIWRSEFYTFADIIPNLSPSREFSAHQRLNDLMEEIELAEQAGLELLSIFFYTTSGLLFALIYRAR